MNTLYTPSRWMYQRARSIRRRGGVAVGLAKRAVVCPMQAHASVVGRPRTLATPCHRIPVAVSLFENLNTLPGDAWVCILADPQLVWLTEPRHGMRPRQPEAKTSE